MTGVPCYAFESGWGVPGSEQVEKPSCKAREWLGPFLTAAFSSVPYSHFRTSDIGVIIKANCKLFIQFQEIKLPVVNDSLMFRPQPLRSADGGAHHPTAVIITFRTETPTCGNQRDGHLAKHKLYCFTIAEALSGCQRMPLTGAG